jgi:hypothetical protein
VAAISQSSQPRFVDPYSELKSQQQQLVDNWVARFNKTTRQSVEPAAFYDEIVSVSAKATFSAVTHALMTSMLTDGEENALGNALSLIEEVDAVRGEVPGTRGDRQFRMYVRLRPDAQAVLSRSREFRRGADNSVYHKGYPINYRGQGGTPSLQISMALDGRRADIDVDYRPVIFPVSLFNGHLTAANSDVRAGNNYDRHAARWAGLRNWWRSYIGVSVSTAAQPESRDAPRIPTTPRAGKKSVEVMTSDFLRAWLVEGNIVAAMSYVSDRAYACVAEDADDPSKYDMGMAPFQLMANLKAARDAIGQPDSLQGLVSSAHLGYPSLRVVPHPDSAQFAVYAVPDDVAVGFDCSSDLTLESLQNAPRSYGRYFVSAFSVATSKNSRVALLWAKVDDYWKIVSWKAGLDDEDAATSVASAPAAGRAVLAKADPGLVAAARDFLESWLVRKDYDSAFQYLSPKAYGCYDLERPADAPASTSPADAGQKIRASLERTGDQAHGKRLAALIASVEPVNPGVNLLDHPYRPTFALTSLSAPAADASECDARARGTPVSDRPSPEDGHAFGMNLRFRTRGGDAPVLRTLWRRDAGNWRITSYMVEMP